MIKGALIVILGIVCLLAFSVYYARRCRARLFKRVASFPHTSVAASAGKLRNYISDHHPEIANASLEDTAPLLEELIKGIVGPARFDVSDNEALVLAIGSYIGDGLAADYSGRWHDSPESGPALVFGHGDAELTMHPVEKAAAFREFGTPGDLHAYIVAAREIGREMNNRATACS